MTDGYQLFDGVLHFAPGTQYIRSQIYCAKSDVKKIIIPPGTGFMEDECFAECPELEEAVLPEGLVNIGPASFADCPKLRAVNIPSTVRSIDTGAFFGCASLREVLLPPGLERISELAFQESGLEAVAVPESVKSIEECAFFSCERLRRADVNGFSTLIGQDAFGSDYALAEGYIAPGYPEICDNAAELLYTMLWCSCPGRHDARISRRAEEFIRKNEELVMERILKFNNLPAMTGLAERALLSSAAINDALQTALRNGHTELAALLLQAKTAAASSEEEFDL